MTTNIDVHSGQVWLSGSGVHSVTPNERLKMTIHNHEDADGHAVIGLLVMGASSEFFLDSWIDPTGNLPTTQMPVNNAIWDGRTYDGAVTVKADVSNDAFSGGSKTATSMVIGSSGLLVPMEIHVPPGHTFGFQTNPQPGNNEAALAFSFVEL